MKETVDTAILLLAYGLAILAIFAGALWAGMWLIGQILKLLGYYKMFMQVMFEMAKQGKFRGNKS